MKSRRTDVGPQRHLTAREQQGKGGHATTEHSVRHKTKMPQLQHTKADMGGATATVRARSQTRPDTRGSQKLTPRCQKRMTKALDHPSMMSVMSVVFDLSIKNYSFTPYSCFYTLHIILVVEALTNWRFIRKK
jgi:hypothetical protein